MSIIIDSPLVSVVIPTYNRAGVLGRALTSVLNQTFPDLECIVVDDGSTDQTVALVEEFQDPRLRLLRLPVNRGVCHARNVGIQAARGELIAFLDSDDEWLPQKLELQIRRLRGSADPKATVVYCLCYRRDGTTDRLTPHRTLIYEGDVFGHLLTGWHPPTASQFLVTRASMVDAGSFDEELPYAEDYDLWLRLAEAHNHFAAVGELLVIKHENTGPQLTTDPFLRLEGAQLFDRKWRPVIKRHLGSTGYRRWRAGRDRLIKGFLRTRPNMYDTVSGKRVSSWRWLLMLLRLLPWSRRYLIHGLALLTLGPPAYEIAWWAKKTLWRVLTESEAWVVMASLAWSGQKQVSAMIRVKDEEEFLYPSVKSIVDYVEEIVLIDNGSTDRTPSIMESLRREYPDKVVCYQYNYEVRKVGWEGWETLHSEGYSSPHLSASFYNWCLRRCTKPYILKWDGDMIATEAFSESMRAWRKSHKVFMTFKGVNVHPNGRHMMASKSTDQKELVSSLRLSAIPSWVTSLTYTYPEPRVFPRFRAKFDMGNKFTQRLCTPVSNGLRVSHRCYKVAEVCYLHLKFCKREPYSGYSSELAEVISSNIAVGQPLRPEWLDLLRRWRVEDGVSKW